MTVKQERQTTNPKQNLSVKWQYIFLVKVLFLEIYLPSIFGRNCINPILFQLNLHSHYNFASIIEVKLLQESICNSKNLEILCWDNIRNVLFFLFNKIMFKFKILQRQINLNIPCCYSQLFLNKLLKNRFLKF